MNAADRMSLMNVRSLRVFRRVFFQHLLSDFNENLQSVEFFSTIFLFPDVPLELFYQAKMCFCA